MNDETQHDQFTDTPLSTNVTVREHTALVHLYPVSEEQLENLASAQWNIHASFAGTLFGVFVSMLAILLTGLANASPIDHATIVAITFSSAVLTVAFAIFAFKDNRKHRRTLQRIKQR